MRIAVTGNKGQVVSALLERGPLASVEIMAVGRPLLDLAEPNDLVPVFAALRPDVIVSAAAYTAVDKAESEPELAFAINGEGAGAVARAAAAIGVPIIHISTDYVFDGSKSSAWTEADPVAPLGVYGASKLAGEQAVSASGARAAILRVAWVFSPFAANFVRTMLRLGESRDRIAVVADQLGAPTSAFDIADGILRVAANLAEASAPSRYEGLFHMGAGGPDASWADFAEAIFACSVGHGGKGPAIDRIGTQEYPTPAKRPANSRLDSAKLADIHGVALPDWRGAVTQVVDRIFADASPTANS
jgi:dTDP-4-dehydrorhamnose reductase